MGPKGNWTDSEEVNGQLNRIFKIVEESKNESLQLLILSAALGIFLKKLPDDMVNNSIDRVVRYSGKKVDYTIIHTIGEQFD